MSEIHISSETALRNHLSKNEVLSDDSKFLIMSARMLLLPKAAS